MAEATQDRMPKYCTVCWEFFPAAQDSCPRCSGKLGASNTTHTASLGTPSAFKSLYLDDPDEKPDLRMLAARSAWNAALEAAADVADMAGDRPVAGTILALREKV